MPGILGNPGAPGIPGKDGCNGTDGKIILKKTIFFDKKYQQIWKTIIKKKSPMFVAYFAGFVLKWS